MTIRILSIATIVFCGQMLVASVNAADNIVIDESSMFSDTQSLVDSSKLVNTAAFDTLTKEKKSLGFSGNINAVGDGILSQKYFEENASLANSSTQFGLIGDAFIDARLLLGYKAFLSLEMQYSPTVKLPSFAMPEVFVDANIAKHVYFRAGKQVLQWGRCYFFTPTDLVNVEHKSFIPKIGQREGTFGVKTTIPFGTLANLYGFIDLNHATRADSVAGAGRCEVRISGVELAASAWGRKYRNPVFGADASFGFFGIQFAAEGTLSKGGNLYRMTETSGALYTVHEKDLVYKGAFDIGRAFTIGEITDRLQVTGEVFLNSAGTSENVFADSSTYKYSSPVLSSDPLTGANISAMSGTKTQFFFGKNLYSPNEYGRCYAALFTSFTHFIIADMTASANAMLNCTDGSAIIAGDISYTNLANLTIDLSVTGFVGAQKHEYTMSGNAMDIRLNVGLGF